MFLKDKWINVPSKGQFPVLYLPVWACFCCAACLTSLFIYLVNDSHIFLHYSFILLYLLSLTCPSWTPSLFPLPPFSSPPFCVRINDMKSQRLRLLLYPPCTRSPHLHTHTTLTQIMSIHARSQSSSSALADRSPHKRRVAKRHLSTKVVLVPLKQQKKKKPEDIKVALKWRDVVRLSLVQWVELCEQTLRGKEKKQAKDWETVNACFNSSRPYLALFPADRSSEREERCRGESAFPLGTVPINWRLLYAVEFQLGINTCALMGKFIIFTFL